MCYQVPSSAYPIITYTNWPIPDKKISKISNPYKVEVLKGKDGQIYEVLLYYTDVKKMDGAITDDELTPLIIKDGKLQGWGWVFFNEILQ